MALTPQALRLLSKELVRLRSDPPEGVRVIVDEDDLTAVEGLVQGPSGTPYEGGYFRIRFNFGPEYPNIPPKCTMITKIFHPNMSKQGEICVDTLKKGWKREYGVGHVLVTIKCLLIYPNPESALDEEAGKQLLADYDGYCKYARLMTSIHATPKITPIEFRDSSSKSSPSAPTPIAGLNLIHLPSSIPSSHSRPPNSTSSTTSSSTTTTTVTTTSTKPTASTRPAPLQAHAQQEQSPVMLSEPTAGEPEKPLKTVSSTKTPAKTAGAKAGAKRGLKRL
ncbi:ubiquitin-conjugating enzyme/RWD-like protein [Kockovaella imperatae]|uniref:E2 ubiquitin-conjugating enzyme n=1 Tax=Kockovaella imperatae TaxID=4999 RepID=A0A1Y1UGU3_9TREE|nr:ubiquitin-conjugating enzyme/RWD-like protein [Kockovaella imperatae]ORX37283.1 ubiquitin-conjugating enzyme/RWD-like protein [Kockovaella imperatae]